MNNTARALIYVQSILPKSMESTFLSAHPQESWQILSFRGNAKYLLSGSTRRRTPTRRISWRKVPLCEELGRPWTFQSGPQDIWMKVHAMHRGWSARVNDWTAHWDFTQAMCCFTWLEFRPWTGPRPVCGVKYSFPVTGFALTRHCLSRNAARRCFRSSSSRLIRSAWKVNRLKIIFLFHVEGGSFTNKRFLAGIRWGSVFCLANIRLKRVT